MCDTCLQVPDELVPEWKVVAAEPQPTSPSAMPTWVRTAVIAGAAGGAALLLGGLAVCWLCAACVASHHGCDMCVHGPAGAGCVGCHPALCPCGITSAPAGAVSRMQCSGWRHLLAASCAWALPPPTRATRAAVDCSSEAWGLCLPAAAGVHCGIAAGILGMVLPIALGSHWTSQLMAIIVSA